MPSKTAYKNQSMRQKRLWHLLNSGEMIACEMAPSWRPSKIRRSALQSQDPRLILD